MEGMVNSKWSVRVVWFKRICFRMPGDEGHPAFCVLAFL